MLISTAAHILYIFEQLIGFAFYVIKKGEVIMGLFLQTAIVKDCNFSQAEKYIQKISSAAKEYEIVPAECRLSEQHGDVFICFNDHCCGFEDLAKDLSIESKSPVMLLYIYDGDFWAYELYDNGEHIDSFNPMPNYFDDEIDDAIIQSHLGNSKIVSEYFNVDEDSIKNYLVQWTDETDYEEKAYEDDSCGYDDWQMVDFLEKLGYDYGEE